MLTWQVIAAARVLPVALVAVGIGVPAAAWSQLPPPKPGPMLLACVPAAIGVLVVLPQALRPVVTGSERFQGPLTTGYLPGLTVGLLQTKFGRLAVGIFFLSEAAGRTVALAATNLGDARWHTSFSLTLAATAGSLLVAVGAGVTLRRYG